MQLGSAPRSGHGGTWSAAGLRADASKGRRFAVLALVLFGTLALQRADAAGETRTLNLFNIHTKDHLTVTYKKNGRFDDAALSSLNRFLRDWRQEKETRMDPQLFDMLWEVHREVKATGPIHVVSGYRSPTTNSMLRGRSRQSGVARTSLHMQGKAIDFTIPSANVADVRAAALRIQGGGVGYYPTSGVPFVHMDVGNVRHWPRMTREQLVKVFPHGRTLHVPTDGEPLPGYQLALADRERGVRPDARVQQPRSLMASLFGGGQENEETEDRTVAATVPAATATSPRRAPAAPAPVQVAANVAAPAVPLPLSRPAVPARPEPPVETFQVASAASTPVPTPTPRPVRLAALSPNQVIEERGFWQGLPDMPPPAQALAAAAPPQTHAPGAPRGARGRTAVDPATTAGLGPFARNDGAPSDTMLGYATPFDSRPALAAARTTPAVITSSGTTSVAVKPSAAPAARSGAVRPNNDPQRLNDPWLRGVVVAQSISRGMTTTTFGAPDFRTLQPFLQKPASTLAMSFSDDPGRGLTTTAFTGSAVVFQATVTFPTRTAALR